MTISSRTPEGVPHCCPVCQQVAALEPCFPGGDSVCPSCGHLLWWFRDRVAVSTGLQVEPLRLDAKLRDWALDSLAVVELVLEFEETFRQPIADEDYVDISTVADFVRLIRRMQTE